MGMKIAAVTCTYLRPAQLARLLYCFLQQDWPDRELVILDDAGQYDPQQGDRWRLVLAAERYPTLGEKRNAAAALVAPDTAALAVWDDDDLYLPWALSASVAALEKAPWSRPSVVLHMRPSGALVQHRTGGLFHGGWAYRRAAFRRVNGYAPMDNGEDQDLARRMSRAFEQAGTYPALNNGEDQALGARFAQAGLAWADPIRLGFRPFYVYSWGPASGWHLSGMGADGYQRLGRLSAAKVRLTPTAPEGLDLHHPRILPGVRPRVF